VPDDVVAEVLAFIRARSHDPLPSTATTEALNERLVDAALVRDYERAHAAGRRMTADNLALTLLQAAERFSAHRNYQPRWRQWAPFGNLDPSEESGPP
jgi:hypothetical protein